MATLKINGKEITVADGTSILDADKQAGFEIPTFCYLADLSPLGSCRMCLVEIAGQRKPQPSCVTPVLHGMEVLTETDALKSARSAMLDFLLANHPLDCPICDKGGECELQDLAFKYGPRHSPFSEWKRRFHEKDEILSPVIVKNHNRCIHCERCVRICADVVGAKALSGIGRGHKTKETSFMNATLDCDQCGNCVEVCPVGSFMSLPYRYKSRPWDLKETDTVCPYCATGCQLTVGVRNGKVMRVRSKFDAGFNREWLCARGRYGYQFIQNEERLTRPMIKKNGQLVECSWEEALSYVRQRFSIGKRSAGIASARLANEELYLFQKLMRGVFNTNNIDSTSRWMNKATTAAMIDVCGIAGEGISINDAMKADLIFVIGSSISDENPIIDYFIRTAVADRRKTLILAYPRRIKLDSSAVISLKYRPGSEGMVVSGITAAIEKEWVKGQGSRVNLTDTGVSEADILAVAERIKTASNISLFVGTDILRSANGADILFDIANMAKTAKGSGKNIKIMPLLDRCNQRGAWDMGVHPSFLPGYKGTAEGMDCGEVLEAAARGDVDSLYIIGEDVVSLYPDAGFAKDALSKVRFIAVQDMFLTETAKMADVVLPAASFAEKEGTFTNQEGRVQRIKRAAKPASGVKEDWRILCDIGRLFDPAFGCNSVEDVFQEIKANVPSYKDMAYEGINHMGLLVGGQGSGVRSQESEVRNQKSEELKEDTEYPFLLITGNNLFHSGRLSQRAEVLGQLLPESFVEISDRDAAMLGIKDGDRVRVEGRYHKDALKAKVQEGSLPGVVFIAENFDDVRVNRFFKRGEGIPRVKIIKQ